MLTPLAVPVHDERRGGELVVNVSFGPDRFAEFVIRDKRVIVGRAGQQPSCRDGAGRFGLVARREFYGGRALTIRVGVGQRLPRALLRSRPGRYTRSGMRLPRRPGRPCLPAIALVRVRSAASPVPRVAGRCGERLYWPVILPVASSATTR